MPVPEETVDDLAIALEGGAFLLDVREPDEYVEARVPGAYLIPLGELGARIGELPPVDTLHVVCRSGARSARAVQALTDSGRDAVNVAGGTLAWIESGRQVDQG